MPSPWPASFTTTPETVTFTVPAPGLRRERIADAWFYPLSWGAIDHAAAQTVDVTAKGLTLRTTRGALPAAMEAPIDGVLVITERLDQGTARQAFLVQATPAGPGARWGLPGILALALAGGLVLNAMPCVLPVLSVKALALVRHAGAGRAVTAAHGLAYAAGVLVSFAVLAGALLALRAGGERIGWGFQLQTPWFVTLLAYVFFAMALALSGVLPISGRLTGLGQGLTARGGFAGSFFTGTLATVAATPCTAPFMGTAVGFAVTQPWGTAFLVFGVLGLGLALPFLLLSLMPAWRRFLPRPGPWMERLQQLLAFPLYASVAWLVWVLSQQVGPPGVAVVLVGLVLLGFAAWLRNAGRLASPPWRRVTAGGAAVAVALTVATLGLVGPAARESRPAETPAGAGWEPFSPASSGGAPRRGHSRVRELHGRLVRYLSGERTRGAPLPGRGTGLRRQRGRPAPGRLDPSRRADHRSAGRLRPERRAALPALPENGQRLGWGRGDRAAPDPDRGHGHPGREPDLTCVRQGRASGGRRSDARRPS